MENWMAWFYSDLVLRRFASNWGQNGVKVFSTSLQNARKNKKTTVFRSKYGGFLIFARILK